MYISQRIFPIKQLDSRNWEACPLSAKRLQTIYQILYVAENIV